MAVTITRHAPARVAIPGDMEQAEKPIRVRNAGDTCVLWPVRFTPDLARVLCTRDARTHLRAPRARRFAQSFRTPLWENGTGMTGKSWGRSEHGAMTRACPA